MAYYEDETVYNKGDKVTEGGRLKLKCPDNHMWHDPPNHLEPLDSTNAYCRPQHDNSPFVEYEVLNKRVKIQNNVSKPFHKFSDGPPSYLHQVQGKAGGANGSNEVRDGGHADQVSRSNFKGS